MERRLAENVRIPSYGGWGPKIVQKPSYDILNVSFNLKNFGQANRLYCCLWKSETIKRLATDENQERYILNWIRGCP